MKFATTHLSLSLTLLFVLGAGAGAIQAQTSGEVAEETEKQELDGQDKDKDENEAERAEGIDFRSGWDEDGAFIESADKNLKLWFGGRLQADYRHYTADFAEPSTFLIRRARLEVEGTLYRIFELKIQADFADVESVLLRDGFVNIHAKDVVQVIAGQFKAPFSQEELQSSKYYGFVERAMVNNIAPGRSPGVMVHGNTKADVFLYEVSFQNDGGELGLNQNGTEDLFGRVRFEPWTEGVLDTLSFGGAFGFGKREGERFVVGRTSSRSVVFFDKVPLSGNLVRRNVEGWWYPGPWLVQAECDDVSGQRLGLGEDGADLPNVEAGGCMVQALYVLTGETNDPDEPIEPSRPVHEGGPGAWEVGARYQVFEVEGVNQVKGFSVGINWWMNRYFRVQQNLSWESFQLPPDPLSGETFNFAYLARIGIYF